MVKNSTSEQLAEEIDTDEQFTLIDTGKETVDDENEATERELGENHCAA